MSDMSNVALTRFIADIASQLTSVVILFQCGEIDKASECIEEVKKAVAELDVLENGGEHDGN